MFPPSPTIGTGSGSLFDKFLSVPSQQFDLDNARREVEPPAVVPTALRIHRSTAGRRAPFGRVFPQKPHLVFPVRRVDRPLEPDIFLAATQSQVWSWIAP